MVRAAGGGRRCEGGSSHSGVRKLASAERGRGLETEDIMFRKRECRNICRSGGGRGQRDRSCR